MNSIEFSKKIVEALGSKHQAVTNQTVDNTVEVIREFSQDLANDLADALNGRVSSDTVSVVIEVLNMITNEHKDKETIQREVYKLGLQVKETSITVENPF